MEQDAQDEIENILQQLNLKILKMAFVNYNLGKIKLSDMDDELRNTVVEMSTSREFLEGIINDDKVRPCKCGGDHCPTVDAAKAALAKLDGSNVIQIASWTKH